VDAALSYTIIITQSPALSESHLTAQRFIGEAIANGDKIDRVFFYQDAAYVGLSSQVPGQGLHASYQGWIELQQQQAFPLQICIANALRRGVIDETEAKRYQTLETLQKGFELTGLGEIADACQSSDRIITL
jgi:tRNA 2-thiouridine synthesizing protein D|tara:strand:- start:218 stop:613 length:396 start_codon:yes stop_codon:yes gene_type:complete